MFTDLKYRILIHLPNTSINDKHWILISPFDDIGNFDEEKIELVPIGITNFTISHSIGGVSSLNLSIADRSQQLVKRGEEVIGSDSVIYEALKELDEIYSNYYHKSLKETLFKETVLSQGEVFKKGEPYPVIWLKSLIFVDIFDSGLGKWKTAFAGSVENLNYAISLGSGMELSLSAKNFFDLGKSFALVDSLFSGLLYPAIIKAQLKSSDIPDEDKERQTQLLYALWIGQYPKNIRELIHNKKKQFRGFNIFSNIGLKDILSIYARLINTKTFSRYITEEDLPTEEELTSLGIDASMVNKAVEVYNNLIDKYSPYRDLMKDEDWEGLMSEEIEFKDRKLLDNFKTDIYNPIKTYLPFHIYLDNTIKEKAGDVPTQYLYQIFFQLNKNFWWLEESDMGRVLNNITQSTFLQYYSMGNGDTFVSFPPHDPESELNDYIILRMDKGATPLKFSISSEDFTPVAKFSHSIDLMQLDDIVQKFMLEYMDLDERLMVNYGYREVSVPSLIFDLVSASNPRLQDLLSKYVRGWRYLINANKHSTNITVSSIIPSSVDEVGSLAITSQWEWIYLIEGITLSYTIGGTLSTSYSLSMGMPLRDYPLFTPPWFYLLQIYSDKNLWLEKNTHSETDYGKGTKPSNTYAPKPVALSSEARDKRIGFGLGGVSRYADPSMLSYIGSILQDSNELSYEYYSLASSREWAVKLDIGRTTIPRAIARALSRYTALIVDYIGGSFMKEYEGFLQWDGDATGMDFTILDIKDATLYNGPRNIIGFLKPSIAIDGLILAYKQIIFSERIQEVPTGKEIKEENGKFIRPFPIMIDYEGEQVDVIELSLPNLELYIREELINEGFDYMNIFIKVYGPDKKDDKPREWEVRNDEYRNAYVWIYYNGKYTTYNEIIKTLKTNDDYLKHYLHPALKQNKVANFYPPNTLKISWNLGAYAPIKEGEKLSWKLLKYEPERVPWWKKWLKR